MHHGSFKACYVGICQQSVTQCIYMTLEKIILLGLSDHDRIVKMHVYTLVWLKLDQIGCVIIWLKHLDYSIDSRITPACIHSIWLDSEFVFCSGSRFFSQGCEPEVEGQRWHLSSEITASKNAILHLVCVIIMYTIYEMYKDVASSCSSYAIFLKCQCGLLLLVM